MKNAAVDEKVRTIPKLLDLSAILKKIPSCLAGGQQQRVRAEIRTRIRHLRDEMKNTTVYVTHDQAGAVAVCDRMVILHQAKLQQIGTVEKIWHRPRTSLSPISWASPQ